MKLRRRTYLLSVATVLLLGANGRVSAQVGGPPACAGGPYDGVPCGSDEECVGGLCVVPPIPTPCGDSCPSITIGTATGVPGESVTIAVTLHAGAAAVAGFQNDIAFDLSTPIVACTANPAINKSFTNFRITESFARAIVLGLSSDPIPDGAVAYTCTVAIAPDAALGTHPLTISGVIGSDGLGNRLETNGESGAIVVEPPAPGATPIPPRSATPTPAIGGPLPPDAAVSIEVGAVKGLPGQRVTFAVTLGNPGFDVFEMQNDITFDPTTAIDVAADGKPDCQAGAEMSANGTAFVFVCTPDAGCTTMRAEVVAPRNGGPIGDGTVLYTCNATVAADAPPESFPLVASLPSAGDLLGTSLPTVVRNGSIDVLTPPGETPRPTRTPTATINPVVSIEVGDAVGAPGDLVVFDVTLRNSGGNVVATQNDIYFDSNVSITACKGNPDINKMGEFAFGNAVVPGAPGAQPCTRGADCNRLRALVLAFDNVDPIPEGSVLYTCTVRIAATAAAGDYQLMTTGVVVSDPRGNALPVTGRAGTVIVVGGPTRTAAPTATGTPDSITAWTPVATLGPIPAVPPGQPGGGVDAASGSHPVAAGTGGGGCSTVAPQRVNRSAASAVLLPAALVLLKRFRRRRGRND